MTNVPECFYRVSAKALILNEERDKFLIMQESNGQWDLPGGGLDWGTSPQEDVEREIVEELSLKVLSVSGKPSYFYTNPKPRKSDPERFIWCAYVLYEVELENLDFTPSDECVAIRFVDKENLPQENVHLQVSNLADVFDPSNHAK